jgi:hypothetical protein
MGIEHGMWTHGHSISIEQPEALQAVFYRGFMVELIGKPNFSAWVHYAVPTPVIASNNRLRADAVMIRYRTGVEDKARLAAIHVYDGELKIASFDGLQGASQNWSISRTEIPNKPYVEWGIGISILVQFKPLANPLFQISSVGCDFLV